MEGHSGALSPECDLTTTVMNIADVTAARGWGGEGGEGDGGKRDHRVL